MKNVFYKFLSLAVLVSAFVVPARAQHVLQLEDKTLPVGEFSSVNVDGDFNITLSKGSYSVQVTADRNLMPYVQVYVRAKTLYVSYDEKSVPKDIKKLFKGKDGASPVFRATVSMPELNGIEIQDNVTLYSSEEFSGSNVTLSLNEKSQIQNLSLRANSITVNMKKNAQASLALNADKRIELNTDDKSVLKATGKANDLTVIAKGSSDNSLSGECEDLTLKLSERSNTSISMPVSDKVILDVDGSSKLSLNGKAELLEAKADRNAEVEANGFPVKKMKAELKGGKLNVNVEKELNVTLEGGSALYFMGTPTLIINKIIKSTLAPAGSVK